MLAEREERDRALDDLAGTVGGLAPVLGRKRSAAASGRRRSRRWRRRAHAESAAASPRFRACRGPCRARSGSRPRALEPSPFRRRDLAPRRLVARVPGKDNGFFRFHAFSFSVDDEGKLRGARGSRRQRLAAHRERRRSRAPVPKRTTTYAAGCPSARQTPSMASCGERPRFAITATAAASCQARRAAGGRRRSRRRRTPRRGDPVAHRRRRRRARAPPPRRRPRASRCGLAALAAVEALDVEVDAQHERQQSRSPREPASPIWVPSATKSASRGRSPSAGCGPPRPPPAGGRAGRRARPVSGRPVPAGSSARLARWGSPRPGRRAPATPSAAPG